LGHCDLLVSKLVREKKRKEKEPPKWGKKEKKEKEIEKAKKSS
jgi:hypothetical protein